MTMSEEEMVNIEDLEAEDLRQLVIAQAQQIEAMQDGSHKHDDDSPPATKVNYVKIRTAAIEIELQSPEASSAELVTSAIFAAKEIDTKVAMPQPTSTPYV